MNSSLIFNDFDYTTCLPSMETNEPWLKTTTLRVDPDCVSGDRVRQTSYWFTKTTDYQILIEMYTVRKQHKTRMCSSGMRTARRSGLGAGWGYLSAQGVSPGGCLCPLDRVHMSLSQDFVYVLHYSTDDPVGDICTWK